MDMNTIKKDLKEFFCNNLGIDGSALEYDTPLFSDGIGLDSIDSLEIIAHVDDKYGISMTGVGKDPFYNIDSLAKYIVDHKE